MRLISALGLYWCYRWIQGVEYQHINVGIRVSESCRVKMLTHALQQLNQLGHQKCPSRPHAVISILHDHLFKWLSLLIVSYRVLIGITISSLSPICGNFLLYVVNLIFCVLYWVHSVVNINRRMGCNILMIVSLFYVGIIQLLCSVNYTFYHTFHQYWWVFSTWVHPWSLYS